MIQVSFSWQQWFYSKRKMSLLFLIGCHFASVDSELAKHMEKDVKSHLECICKSLSSIHSSCMPNDKLSTSVSDEALKQLLFTDID